MRGAQLLAGIGFLLNMVTMFALYLENQFLARVILVIRILPLGFKTRLNMTCPPKTVPVIMLGIDKKGAIDGKERLHTGADY